MLTLKLYPAEFATLISYLREVMETQQSVPLQYQPVAVLVLMQYFPRWKPHQLLRWSGKNPRKEFRLNLPLPVAKAIYDDLLLVGFALTDRQRLLLGKLDQAIVNYRDPMSLSDQFLTFKSDE